MLRDTARPHQFEWRSILPYVVAPTLLIVSLGATLSGRSTVSAAQLCGWPRGAIGDRNFGNTGVIDSKGLYLVMNFARDVGVTLRLHGQFPHSRYMSVTAYGGRSAVAVDHLLDAQIVPDPGSTNPFLPGANRNATQRWYTIYLRQGIAPTLRATNTIYTGPYHPVLAMYRVYAPDKGADDYGDVPAPQVSLIVQRIHKSDYILPLQTCAPLQALRGAAAVFGVLGTSLTWKRVGAVNGTGVNADDAYLDLEYHREDAEEYVFRFKPPTFAQTYRGKPITGKEDVRYWSLCQYDQQSGKVIACLHDYDAVVARNGYVTLLVSTPDNRPPTATAANGINWLPFGSGDTGVLVYRQLLPRPSFAGNLQNVSPEATFRQVQTVLGAYYPTIRTCAEVNFTPTTCSDLIDSRQCSDLLEPMPCKPLVPQDRRATLRLAARPDATRGTQTVQ